jgi:hypothetical protein
MNSCTKSYSVKLNDVALAAPYYWKKSLSYAIMEK